MNEPEVTPNRESNSPQVEGFVTINAKEWRKRIAAGGADVVLANTVKYNDIPYRGTAHGTDPSFVPFDPHNTENVINPNTPKPPAPFVPYKAG